MEIFATVLVCELFTYARWFCGGLWIDCYGIERVAYRRSLTMDIEHLQLFCPQSLMRLLRHAGYRAVEVRPVTNAFPLDYWVRLLPLPRPVRALVQRVLGPWRKRMVRVS